MNERCYRESGRSSIHGSDEFADLVWATCFRHISVRCCRCAGSWPPARSAAIPCQSGWEIEGRLSSTTPGIEFELLCGNRFITSGESAWRNASQSTNDLKALPTNNAFESWIPQDSGLPLAAGAEILTDTSPGIDLRGPELLAARYPLYLRQRRQGVWHHSQCCGSCRAATSSRREDIFKTSFLVLKTQR